VRPKGVTDGNQVNIPGLVGSDESQPLYWIIGFPVQPRGSWK
jgi:hypothetical protein